MPQTRKFSREGERKNYKIIIIIKVVENKVSAIIASSMQPEMHPPSALKIMPRFLGSFAMIGSSSISSFHITEECTSERASFCASLAALQRKKTIVSEIVSEINKQNYQNKYSDVANHRLKLTIGHDIWQLHWPS